MNRYDGIDERVVSNVRIFARNLKRTNMLRSMEIEDVEQELMCEAIKCLHNFDERLGEFEHYIRKILARCAANLLRSFSCAKRGPFVGFKEYAENDNFDENAIENHCVDLNWLMDYLPSHYKTLCKLLMSHSITEASKITGKSRGALYRDLKHISLLVNQRNNSEDNFFALFYSGVNMKNLSVLETLSAKEISALDVYDLMDLHEQLTKLICHTKELKEKLDESLNLRFAESVKNNLPNENKDTGAVKFFDGAFQIVANVPRKVIWDNEKMEELVKHISDEQKKAFVKIAYSIEEQKYSALPRKYQELFEKARTIMPGKTRFQITIGE